MSHYAFMNGACGVVIEADLGANPAGTHCERTGELSVTRSTNSRAGKSGRSQPGDLLEKKMSSINVK